MATDEIEMSGFYALSILRKKHGHLRGNFGIACVKLNLNLISAPIDCPQYRQSTRTANSLSLFSIYVCSTTHHVIQYLLMICILLSLLQKYVEIGFKDTMEYSPCIT